MAKKELSDKNKNIISIFAIVSVAILFFVYLFFSTNLFNFDAEGMARIQKAEKGLDVQIPNIVIEGEDYVGVKENKKDIVIPSISDINPAEFKYYDFIAHPLYPDFAEAHQTSINNGALSISDTIIYNTGYYSINGNAWTPYTLQGNPYTSGSPWLLDRGTSNLNLPSQGTHYVLVYSCSYVNNDWDCHGNMWQLNIVEDSNPVGDCGDENCGSGESCYNCEEDCGACPVGSGLLAGTAKVNINPPIGQPLGGYDNYDGSTSIHDDLHARVLVLQENGVTIAFVSLDLLMFSSDNVINSAKQQYGIDYVILSSSHTHAGPIPRQMMDWEDWDVNPDEEMDWDSFSNDPWYAETENKVVAAIGEASNSLFPASISAGKGMLDSNYLSFNRRRVSSSGSVTMWWENSDRTPTSPLDHTVGVVRIDDSSGNTRAMMVNYAAHPVHTSGWNSEVSADYPGAMSSYIENQLGPDSVALFINGAAGDIDPYDQGSNSFSSINGAGRDLAQEALSVQTEIANGNSIEVSSVAMPFEDRWESSRTQYAGLTTIVIHDSIAFVTFVGEMFIQHQINLYERSPLQNTFLYGYSYSGQGGHYLMYLPTREAAYQGGDNYGGNYVTYLEVGAGEAMINEGLRFINQVV